MHVVVDDVAGDAVVDGVDYIVVSYTLLIMLSLLDYLGQTHHHPHRRPNPVFAHHDLSISIRASPPHIPIRIIYGVYADSPEK